MYRFLWVAEILYTISGCQIYTTISPDMIEHGQLLQDSYGIEGSENSSLEEKHWLIFDMYYSTDHFG